MAEAVRQAIETGEHLAVQAGTGTGKSLAYLVPAVRHALTTGNTVVVATATIALQRQLIDRDLPRLSTALAPLLGREPSFAILKGRRNYLCLHRQRGGVAEDPQDALFDPADSVRSGGRPHLAPRTAGQAAARVGRGNHDRGPGRTGARRARGGLAPGLGERAGVHRRAALPVRLPLFRRAGQGCGGARRHRGDQPRAAGDRRHLRDRRAARARRSRRRRGARPSGPGHLGHDRGAVRSRRGHGRPPGRAADRVRRHRGRRFCRGRPAAPVGGRARHRPRRRARGPDGCAVRHAGRHADVRARRRRGVRGCGAGQRGVRGGGPAADGDRPDDPGLTG